MSMRSKTLEKVGVRRTCPLVPADGEKSSGNARSSSFYVIVGRLGRIPVYTVRRITSSTNPQCGVWVWQVMDWDFGVWHRYSASPTLRNAAVATRCRVEVRSRRARETIAECSCTRDSSSLVHLFFLSFPLARMRDGARRYTFHGSTCALIEQKR